MRIIIIALLVVLVLFSVNQFTSKVNNTAQQLKCVDCEGNVLGGIEGIVLNKDGAPVTNAVARAERDGIDGRIHTTKTDKHGKFALLGLPLGSYKVYAGNDADGYPELLTSFYLDYRQPATINVNKGIISSVTIIFGDKLGIISGKIVNAKTNKGVPGAILRINVVNDLNRFYQTSIDEDGTFKIAVPPEPVTLKVIAEGYQIWELSSSSEKDGLEGITVLAGNVRNLKIPLKK